MGVFYNSNNANRYGTSLKRSAVERPKYEILERFDSGHGFALSAGAGTLSDETTIGDFISGDQGLKLVVDQGDLADNDIVNAAISPTLDITSKMWGIIWKCSNPDAISELRIHIGQSASNAFSINLKSTFQNIFRGADVWNFSLIDLTRCSTGGTAAPSGIDYCRIRCQTDGSEEITFHIDSIIAVPEGAAGCVIFAGDDNKVSHYEKASRLLMKHGFKGTFYLIAETLGNASILSVEQAQELQNIGHEICSHAITDLTTLSEEGIRQKFIEVKQKMIEYGLQSPAHFAYPGGIDNETVIKVTKEFFSTGRIATSPIISNPPADPFVLGCHAIQSSQTVANITDAIDDAMTANCPIIVLFHEIVDAGATGNEILTADFEAVVDHVNTQGYTTKTLSEYYKDV